MNTRDCVFVYGGFWVNFTCYEGLVGHTMKLRVFGKELTIDCGCDLRKAWITKWWAGLDESKQKIWLGKTFSIFGWFVTIDANGNVTKMQQTADGLSVENVEKVAELQAGALKDMGAK